MEITNVDQQAYVDLFATDNQQQNANPNSPKFGLNDEENTVDLFGKPKEEEKNLPDTGEKKKEGEEDQPELDEDGKPKEVDILSTGDKGTPGRKPKYGFEDAVGYFEDRFKTGKFVKVTTENEKGEEVDFIPKTPEEFDEVIDIQVNYKLDQKKKELETNWYKDKPQAWQVVAKYAELVDNPADIIPFIQGVRTIESVSAINEEEIDGAEKIVRTRMEQKGETEDVIEEQIELLKTTDKLISLAKKYKPLILNDEKTYLSQLKKDAEAERLQFEKIVSDISTKAIQAIEQPIFGKQKLRQEEKAVIYDLIGQPDQESKGYKIYSQIDSLFEKGDFDTLKKIALLVSNPASFINYLSIDAKNSTAASLQNKLRVATEGRGNATDQHTEEQVQTVQRNQYSKTPRFGR